MSEQDERNPRNAVEPQPILTPLTAASMFLVLTVTDGAEDDVRGLFPDVASLTRAVGFRALDGGLACVVGIGSQLWDRLFAEPRPAGLHQFHEIVGPTHKAVSTPGDLLLHIRANRMDLCFELAGLLSQRLSGRSDVVDEVHGFRYFDERDLLGFVDGTENPTGIAAAAAVLIGDEQPYFTGGSFVIVQKYVHDLEAWNAASVEEQERVIGRRKLSDVELAEDVKPANSHVALNTVLDQFGQQRQIVRENMSFGNIGSGEFGTYFIGYSSTPEVTEQMLTNMFLGRPPAAHDRILDFSTAVTGSLFFVPSADMLKDPPAKAGRRDVAGTGEPAAAAPPPTSP
ncbi:MAG: Dyp-type peroxidase [Dermatophilaceae bacterium]